MRGLALTGLMLILPVVGCVEAHPDYLPDLTGNSATTDTGDSDSATSTTSTSSTTASSASSSSSSTSSSSSPATSDSTTSGTTTGVSATGMTSTSTGGNTCAEGCTTPPGECFETQGECVNDKCVYIPGPENDPCQAGCGADGLCNAVGQCEPVGTPDDCIRPNAQGGTCVQGQCQGWTCIAPYENCDGNWDNGCEIPVGVPHVCNSTGINEETGCWTAYCGSSNDPEATNFMTFYCMDCSTCAEEKNGCKWCDHDNGNFFPQEMGCACGSYLNAICPEG